MPARVTLRATAGPLSGQDFVFDSHDTFIFGRSPDCHARLPGSDPTASRHHFLLEVQPPVARLRDLGSLNGTYVNQVKHGSRPAGETPEEAARRPIPQVDLKHGDHIEVGETVFTVDIHRPQVCPRCGQEMTGSTCPCATVAQDSFVEDDADLAELLMVLLAEARSAPPQGIPGYTVGRKLGAGGMGAVYQARREADGAEVALKVMLAQAAVNPSSRQLFKREIEVLFELRHPHCVGLYDCGAAGNAFYFVMELCQGGSVDGLMRDRGGLLTVGEATPIILDALTGLAYAHQRGFVHRDLKPQNVLLTGEGRAKLADFGLAKSFESAGFSGMTATGGFAGTGPFMAREQITNFKKVRPATDVWSLGATFYNMLTGHFPRNFPQGRDALEIVLREPVIPIRQRLPGVPARVADVIDRALAERPEDRYVDASAMRDALS